MINDESEFQIQMSNDRTLPLLVFRHSLIMTFGIDSFPARDHLLFVIPSFGLIGGVQCEHWCRSTIENQIGHPIGGNGLG